MSPAATIRRGPGDGRQRHQVWDLKWCYYLDSSGEAMTTAIEMIYGTAFVMLYVTPSIVAFYRAKPSRFGIAFLNLIAGWTMIGWIAAFIWACV